jgi:hypothetical protein
MCKLRQNKEQKMNWLCRLGVHDWEVLESQPDYGRLRSVHKRVCLRCEKKEDTITPYLEQVAADGLVARARIRKAEELWNKS